MRLTVSAWLAAACACACAATRLGAAAGSRNRRQLFDLRAGAPAMTPPPPPRALALAVQPDGSFAVTVSAGAARSVWLASAPPAGAGVRGPAPVYSMWVGGKLSPVVVQSHAKDATGTSATLGNWTGDVFACTAGGVRVELAIKTYADHADVATFETLLPDGASQTQCTLAGCRPNTTGPAFLAYNNAPPVIGFPAFTLDPAASKLAELGKLAIAGDQIQSSTGWAFGGSTRAGSLHLWGCV